MVGATATMTNRDLYIKAAGKFLQFPVIFGLCLFLPAGTFAYWQAWLLSAVFVFCSLALTVYLAIYDPKLLERRMKVGPRAEKETAQKIIVTIAIGSFFATMVLSALDHRFGWSDVPVFLVLFGEFLIVLSYAGFYLIMRENSFSAATIEVMQDQKVISTGPYALVRHPMYSVAFIMILGMPLALGSWWGLLMFFPAVIGIVWRLLDEEDFLSRNLPGYTDYQNTVRFRLVPGVW
jgi:protein-S-isoprenylcysteine O-methyltransferase Ste14